jgi:hypothetical protein
VKIYQKTQRESRKKSDRDFKPLFLWYKIICLKELSNEPGCSRIHSFWYGLHQEGINETDEITYLEDEVNNAFSSVYFLSNILQSSMNQINSYVQLFIKLSFLPNCKVKKKWLSLYNRSRDVAQPG